MPIVILQPEQHQLAEQLTTSHPPPSLLLPPHRLLPAPPTEELAESHSSSPCSMTFDLRPHPSLHPPLLASTTHDRFQSHSRSPPNIQRSNSLWSVEFVATDGHEVHCHGIHINWHLPHCLKERFIMSANTVILFCELVSLKNFNVT